MQEIDAGASVHVGISGSMLSEQTGTLQLLPDNGKWLSPTALMTYISHTNSSFCAMVMLLCITIEQQGTRLTDEDAETVKSLHLGKAGVLSSDKADDC